VGRGFKSLAARSSFLVSYTLQRSSIVRKGKDISHFTGKSTFNYGNLYIFYDGKIAMQRVVEKPWGKEITFAEESFYTGKILEVEKNKRLSYHYHEEKLETLFVISGKIHCIIEDVEYIFETGKTLRFEPGIKHRIEALEDSTLVEVSTFEEGSVRVEDDFGRIDFGCIFAEKRGNRNNGPVFYCRKPSRVDQVRLCVRKCGDFQPREQVERAAQEC
jgi:mannose-6-phosphate isomerase